ncbi:MAG TPA: hypoxanthine phosphoribosyltransferase [Gemmatales bacterium]|nr:hypoxanthine phosphoribosyltransferase [Gemmatales bacterium]HMP58965.1 hypoxanthine phosphoribosyltransferase [Gemmatales bacterium]
MRVLISADDIHRRVEELAAQMNRDFDSEPITLVGILSGSLMFLADLVRKLSMPTRIGFLRASSYRGESTTPGRLEILEGLTPDVRGRHIVVVDDILDSGHTLSQVLEHLRQFEPRSVRSAVLLRKRARQVVSFEPDYCGFEIEDVFVIGYGLDYNDDYRQLPYLAVLDQSET